MLISPPPSVRVLRFGGVRIAAALLALLCLYSAAAETPRHVLILHSFGRDFSPFDEMDSRFRTELARQCPQPVEYIEASLEMTRFAGTGRDEPLLAFLRGIFRERPPDLFVAFGAPAALFCHRHRGALFPQVPLLVAGADKRRLQELETGPPFVAVGVELGLNHLLENILTVQPDTRHIHVVMGVAPLERFWETELKREWPLLSPGVTFHWHAGQSLEQMCTSLRKLPPDSAIFFGVLSRDAAGIPHLQESALAAIHAVAAAPVFGCIDAQFGQGIVGGRLLPMGQVGVSAAGAAVELLAGKPAAAVPGPLLPVSDPVYDWRELQRWGLKESRLPAGSVVNFRKPGLWEEHRKTMIGITAALAVQTALIIALILQRRWRQRAEADLRQQREQLSHTLRLATMSQMASSLAHELNQPLTAIVNNAGTAQSLIAKGRGGAVEISEILQDITDDGHRAGEVIRNIRGMVRKDGGARSVVNLNEVVQSAQCMLAAEFRARDAVLHLETADALPEVEANAVQMQQVLLNLLMNALDALDMPDATARRVVLRTEAEGESAVLVSVRDFGPGLPPEGAEMLFEQYYTTKPNGMGMGLVIVRNLVEAHGGTLIAANAEGGGARFLFRLPALAAAQHDSIPDHSHR
jgi:signal transduction histidine kinase